MLFRSYHPTNGEVPAAMGNAMEGFFDVADIVAEAMASTSTATQGAPAEAIQHYIMHRYNTI